MSAVQPDDDNMRLVPWPDVRLSWRQRRKVRRARLRYIKRNVVIIDDPQQRRSNVRAWLGCLSIIFVPWLVLALVALMLWWWFG